MKKLIIIISVLLIAIMGCRKVEKLEENIVTVTDENVTVGIDNAVVNVSYSYNYELKSIAFLYSENENLSDHVSINPDFSDGNICVLVTNLQPKTTYYYKLKFDSGYNQMMTDVRSFTTLFKDALPTVITGEIANVGATVASCSGEVVSDGNLPVTQRGICWCFHPKPSIDEGSFTIEGSGMGAFSSEMTDLRPNTTYYARAYAMNADGIAYGEDRMFVTPAE